MKDANKRQKIAGELIEVAAIFHFNQEMTADLAQLWESPAEQLIIIKLLELIHFGIPSYEEFLLEDLEIIDGVPPKYPELPSRAPWPKALTTRMQAIIELLEQEFLEETEQGYRPTLKLADLLMVLALSIRE